jgi:hypothetical protein
MSAPVALSLCRARCLASPVTFLISYQLHALGIWSQRFLVGKHMVSCGRSGRPGRWRFAARRVAR